MWLQFNLFFIYVAGSSGIERKDKHCGVEVSPLLVHHNPWLVFLEYYRRDQRIDIRCGGTLIGSKHVLTAAHCVKKIRFSYLVVRLGDYDVTTERDCVGDVCVDPPLRLRVGHIVPHPDYDGSQHDIAVLVLVSDAPYTDFIRPACLPSGQLDADTLLTASGWGIIPSQGHYSHTKKIILLPNWDVALCRAAYSTITLPDKIICAGGEEGIDTCNGDSGGPLVWIRYRIEVWGVTSAGKTPCGTKGFPGIYTKVIDYLDWIKTVVRESM